MRLRISRKPALSERLRGAGVWTPEQNKLVERAAVRYVMRHYGSKGWSARDVSSKNHGYDLNCKTIESYLADVFERYREIYFVTLVN